MKTALWGLLAIASLVGARAEMRFKHHAIPHQPLAGARDYGLTALVDLDRDGDLDLVVGARRPEPSRLYWFEFEPPDRWIEHLVGTNYMSDVGLAAFDVDGNGWIDLVCSGVWYRNTGKPRTEPFVRIVFDASAGGAHDVLAADVDGDRRLDVILMGDERTDLNSLRWYRIPESPIDLWSPRRIGSAVHGAITPCGVGDLDGDGDLDVVRGNVWFENKDGSGRAWAGHGDIPFGRRGPYGICVKCAVVDIDADGTQEIVLADCDIVDSRVAIIKNVGGNALDWQKKELPRSVTYGSLHSLAVADFNGDGRLDIAVNEQEELLPEGRTNPLWVIWENQGGGQFVERIILDAKLGGHELQAGDVDGDGDIDICSKVWGPLPWNGAGGKVHLDFLENLLRVRPAQ